jgi:hypothetical protein
MPVILAGLLAGALGFACTDVGTRSAASMKTMMGILRIRISVPPIFLDDSTPSNLPDVRGDY